MYSKVIDHSSAGAPLVSPLIHPTFSLPVEIWSLIFGKLRPSSFPSGSDDRYDSRQAIRSATLTCRLFCTLAQSLLFDFLSLEFTSYLYDDDSSGREHLKGILQMLEAREESRRWVRHLAIWDGSDFMVSPPQGPMPHNDTNWRIVDQILRHSQGLEVLEMETCLFKMGTFLCIWSLPKLRSFQLVLGTGNLGPDISTLAQLPPIASSTLAHIDISVKAGSIERAASLSHFILLPSIISLAVTFDLLCLIFATESDNSVILAHVEYLRSYIYEGYSPAQVSAVLTAFPSIRRLCLLDPVRWIFWESCAAPQPPLLPLEDIRGSLSMARWIIPGRPVRKVVLELGHPLDQTVSETELGDFSKGSVPIQSMELRESSWTAETLRSLSVVLPQLDELKVAFAVRVAYWNVLERMADDTGLTWSGLRNFEADNWERIEEEFILMRKTTPGTPPDVAKHIQLLKKLKTRFPNLKTAKIEGVRYEFDGAAILPS